jgi:hypothetical protein
MKYKTSELEGALLDAAVAKAEGLKYITDPSFSNPDLPGSVWLTQGKPYAPSAVWRQGGPIIEIERISVKDDIHSGWHSYTRNGVEGHGPTPLIAAMRAYVASKFGEEVELP